MRLTILLVTLIAAITAAFAAPIAAAAPKKPAPTATPAPTPVPVITVTAVVNGTGKHTGFWRTTLSTGLVLSVVQTRIGATQVAPPAVGKRVVGFADQACAFGICAGYATFTVAEIAYKGFRSAP